MLTTKDFTLKQFERMKLLSKHLEKFGTSHLFGSDPYFFNLLLLPVEGKAKLISPSSTETEWPRKMVLKSDELERNGVKTDISLDAVLPTESDQPHVKWGFGVAKHRAPFFMDGVSRDLCMMLTTSTPDGVSKTLKSSPYSYMMIDPASIVFPAKFYNRENMNFLGLPKGTIIPTANGGEVKVVDKSTSKEHFGVADSSGAITTYARVIGSLIVEPIDDEGKKAVSITCRYKNAGTYLASSNLHTNRTDFKFLTDRIKIPSFVPSTLERNKPAMEIILPSAGEISAILSTGFSIDNWLMG